MSYMRLKLTSEIFIVTCYHVDEKYILLKYVFNFNLLMITFVLTSCVGLKQNSVLSFLYINNRCVF